jgi:uncharacterized membrane protein
MPWKMDATERVIFVALVIASVYVASFLAIDAMIQPAQEPGRRGMMAAVYSPYSAAALAAALVPALLAGLAASVKTRPNPGPRKEASEYRILRRAMSKDEAAMYEAVREAGKITQDSLRARLGWTKAKTSRILTNLDRMALVQRERAGKTYNVFLQKRRG